MSSIAEIKKIFAAADMADYESLFEEYEGDEREGVKKILESAHKKRSHWMMKKPECTRCSSLSESTVIRDIYAE